MELENQNKAKPYICQVRLSEDLEQFVNEISKELSCTKSEAIRSIIRACRADFKREGK